VVLWVFLKTLIGGPASIFIIAYTAHIEWTALPINEEESAPPTPKYVRVSYTGSAIANRAVRPMAICLDVSSSPVKSFDLVFKDSHKIQKPWLKALRKVRCPPTVLVAETLGNEHEKKLDKEEHKLLIRNIRFC